MTNGDQIGSIYASSAQCTNIYGARSNSNKVYVLVEAASENLLMIYDSSTSTFPGIYKVNNGILVDFVVNTTGD